MSRKRILYYDILNILACFGVVCLHQNGIVHWYPIDTAAFRQSLLVETCFYWPVPIFFMLSGATLMSYRSRYSTKEFLLRRVKRVLIPFFVFSLLMLVWRCHIKSFSLESLSVRSVLTAILFNQHESIYWFFLPMMATYLCIPVLSLLKDNTRILWYMFFMGFLTLSCCPLLFQFLGIGWNASANFPMTGGYLLFTIEGYLLSVTSFSRRQRRTLYGLAVFSVIFRYAGTVYLSEKAGVLDRTLFDYMQFHSVLLAAGVFVFFKQVRWERLFRSDTWANALASVSSCSFGIYLIHVMIQFYEPGLLGIPTEHILYRTAGCFLTYGVALTVIWTAKKIPLLNKLIP